jgi:hypothetical protein
MFQCLIRMTETWIKALEDINSRSIVFIKSLGDVSLYDQSELGNLKHFQNICPTRHVHRPNLDHNKMRTAYTSVELDMSMVTRLMKAVHMLISIHDAYSIQSTIAGHVDISDRIEHIQTVHQQRLQLLVEWAWAAPEDQGNWNMIGPNGDQIKTRAECTRVLNVRFWTYCLLQHEPEGSSDRSVARIHILWRAKQYVAHEYETAALRVSDAIKTNSAEVNHVNANGSSSSTDQETVYCKEEIVTCV